MGKGGESKGQLELQHWGVRDMGRTWVKLESEHELHEKGGEGEFPKSWF